jgi:hypothetical protein
MSNAVRTFRKDPDAVLDFGLDWSDWLESADVIAASAWTSTPIGLTLASESFDDTKAVVWCSGGLPGTTYTLTNRITTDDGRTDDRSIEVVVTER